MEKEVIFVIYQVACVCPYTSCKFCEAATVSAPFKSGSASVDDWKKALYAAHSCTLLGRSTIQASNCLGGLVTCRSPQNRWYRHFKTENIRIGWQYPIVDIRTYISVFLSAFRKMTTDIFATIHSEGGFWTQVEFGLKTLGLHERIRTGSILLPAAQHTTNEHGPGMLIVATVGSTPAELKSWAGMKYGSLLLCCVSSTSGYILKYYCVHWRSLQCWHSLQVPCKALRRHQLSSTAQFSQSLQHSLQHKWEHCAQQELIFIGKPIHMTLITCTNLTEHMHASVLYWNIATGMKLETAAWTSFWRWSKD